MLDSFPMRKAGKTAIDYMEQWIAMEANPSSLGFDIIAASYWQLKDKKKALKFSERALCVAKANKSKPKNQHTTF